MILANPAYLIMVVVQKPKQVALLGSIGIVPLVSFWLYREREDDDEEEEHEIRLTIVGQRYGAFVEQSDKIIVAEIY